MNPFASAARQDPQPTGQPSGPLARRHNVRVLGKGEAWLVLAHGLGTDQSVWRYMLPMFVPHYRVLVFDLAGAGPNLPGDFDASAYQDISAYSDDLLALLDELEIHHCHHYLGHSVSGAAGLLAAAADPSRFGQLLLINASARYLNDDGYHGGFTPADLEALFQAIQANYEAWAAGFAQQVIDSRYPAEVEIFVKGFLAMRPDVTLSVARTIFRSDIRSILPEVATPTVLIHSRNDVAVPPTVARYLHQHLLRSRLEWMDVQGHFPQLTATSALRKVLGKVLSLRGGS